MPRPLPPLGALLGWTPARLAGALCAAALAAPALAAPTAPRAEPAARPPPAAVEMKDGFPVTRRDRIFPVKDVRRGQRGVGYTVFAGAEAEPFEVEILGLMVGMLGPGKDVILAQLHGEKIEHTGVISGMSGSPVFIDGRLVGAVSYRFGAFAKNPIAGITPIETMLEIDSAAVSPAPPASRPTARAFRAALLRSREAPGPIEFPVAPRGTARSDLQPIATPLMLGGFAPTAARSLGDGLEAAGWVPVVGGTAGSGPHGPSPRVTGRPEPNEASEAARVPAAPIAPGAPVAAVLMRGDLFLSGVGTVTYVEDGWMLGFGHPMFGYGHVDLPMATAAILNTLAALPGSYKQAAPALEVGSVTHDRLTAIGGRFDRVAPMLPVHVRVRRADEPTTARGVTMDVEVLDHELWTPALIQTAISNAGMGRLGFEAGGTFDAVARLQFGDRSLELRDTYAAFAPTPVPALVARDVAILTKLVMGNGLAAASPSRVDVELVAHPETQIAWLDTVTPERRTVRAGETLRLRAELRPYRGEIRAVPIEVTVPTDALPGPLPLLVGGAVELDRRDEVVHGDRIPRDLDDLLGLLAERRPGRGLYARTYPKRAGLGSDVELLSALPPSSRLVLGGRSSNRVREVSQALGPASRVDFPLVVIGAMSLDLQVIR